MDEREKNWDKYIDPRIDDLIKNGFYLEAFYICAATIEHALQSAILNSEGWIEQLTRRTSVKFKKTDEKKIRDMTLGKLIQNFSRYTDDTNLVSQLESFNRIRIRFVHKLLNSSIEELNQEAKDNQTTYYTLVAKLYRFMSDLSHRKSLSIKRTIRKTKTNL